MDPVTLAIVGTVCGGIFFKAIEYCLTRKSRRNGVRAIQPGYDNRWDNPSYVKMIHNTRRLETNELGEAVTMCECEDHKPKAIPPRGSAIKYIPYTPPKVEPLTGRNITVLPNGNRMVNDNGRISFYGPRTPPGKKIMNIEGYEFDVPEYIPNEAKGSIQQGSGGSGMLFAKLTWYRPDGRQMYYSACAFEPRYVGESEADCADCEVTEFYSDQLACCIQKVVHHCKEHEFIEYKKHLTERIEEGYDVPDFIDSGGFVDWGMVKKWN